MTEPRDPMDGTRPNNDLWLEGDDEFIELTEHVAGPSESLDESNLELSYGDETIDLSELAPLLDDSSKDEDDDEDDEILDLMGSEVPADDASLETLESIDDETIDLSDLAMLEEGPPESFLEELGDETIDLSDLAGLEEESHESFLEEFGDAAIDLTDVPELDAILAGEGTPDAEPPDALDEGAIDLTDVPGLEDELFAAEDFVASEEPQIDEAALGFSLPAKSDTTLVDIDLLLADGEESAELPLEPMSGDGFLDDFPGETLLLQDEDEDGDEEIIPLNTEGDEMVAMDDMEPLEPEDGGVLDLSDLVEGAGRAAEPQESAVRERKAPGYPEGTFDLSGIVDEEPVAAPEPTLDEGLERAISEGNFTGISDEQLERVVERVVTTLFKDRIEELVVDAIGKNLSEDIKKMKSMLKDNFG